MLHRNLLLNAMNNAVAIRAALADKNGVMPFCLHPYSSRNHFGVDKNQCPVEEVPTRRLDGVWSELGLTSLRAIKMDVEGAEELVLRGGRQLLFNLPPILIFEINPEARAALGMSPSGAWDFLCSLGYKFFAIQKGAARRIHTPPIGGNVVAATTILV